jgi:hypothetical protein
MKMIAVAVMLAACGDSSRIEKLEGRVAELESLLGHEPGQRMPDGGLIDKWDDRAPVDRGFFIETVQSINRGISDHETRLARIDSQVALGGITAGGAGWWCSHGARFCGRTAKECASMVARVLTTDLKEMKNDCAPKVSAWCKSNSVDCEPSRCEACVETR